MLEERNASLTKKLRDYLDDKKEEKGVEENAKRKETEGEQAMRQAAIKIQGSDGHFKQIREKAKRLTAPKEVSVSSNIGKALRSYLIAKNEPRVQKTDDKSVKYVFNLKGEFGDSLPAVETSRKRENEKQLTVCLAKSRVKAQRINEVFGELNKNPNERTIKPSVEPSPLEKMEIENSKENEKEDFDIFDDVENDMRLLQDASDSKGGTQKTSMSFFPEREKGTGLFGLRNEENTTDKVGIGKRSSAFLNDIEGDSLEEEDDVEAEEGALSKLGIGLRGFQDQKLNSGESGDFYMECFPVGQEGGIGERVDPTLIGKVGKGKEKKANKKKHTNWGNQLAQINKVNINSLLLCVDRREQFELNGMFSCFGVYLKETLSFRED